MKPVLLATVTYNRLELVQRSLESWLNTIDSSLIDMWIVDNGSQDGTAGWVREFAEKHDFVHAILLRKNLGTAVALNLAWREARPGQHRVKADSDIVINTPGFLERALQVFQCTRNVGIVGLRRKDLIERPDHPDPFYRSRISVVPLETGDLVLEACHHVMGSWTLYNAAALPRFGYLYQMQDQGNLYGYDDALACFRMHALGFVTVFLRGWFQDGQFVEVDIDHIDPGEGNDPESWNAEYTRWKQSSAWDWMERYKELASEYQEGKRDPFYSAEWDFQEAAKEIHEVVR